MHTVPGHAVEKTSWVDLLDLLGLIFLTVVWAICSEIIWHLGDSSDSLDCRNMYLIDHTGEPWRLKWTILDSSLLQRSVWVEEPVQGLGVDGIFRELPRSYQVSRMVIHTRFS